MSDALSGDNAAYLSNLYQQYSRNPETIDAKWQRVFRDIDPRSSDGKTNTSGVDFWVIVLGTSLIA